MAAQQFHRPFVLAVVLASIAHLALVLVQFPHLRAPTAENTPVVRVTIGASPEASAMPAPSPAVLDGEVGDERNHGERNTRLSAAPKVPVQVIDRKATANQQSTGFGIQFEETGDSPDSDSLRKRLLASQYFLDKPVIDGQVEWQFDGPDRANEDFYFPSRLNMYTLLGNASPSLPFAIELQYQIPSYESGVAGDLQRFWDVITPEWEHTTKNGTHVTCMFLVIAAGCGWD